MYSGMTFLLHEMRRSTGKGETLWHNFRVCQITPKVLMTISDLKLPTPEGRRKRSPKNYINKRFCLLYIVIQLHGNYPLFIKKPFTIISHYVITFMY